jgi:hypothetical protein
MGLVLAVLSSLGSMGCDRFYSPPIINNATDSAVTIRVTLGTGKVWTGTIAPNRELLVCTLNNCSFDRIEAFVGGRLRFETTHFDRVSEPQLYNWQFMLEIDTDGFHIVPYRPCDACILERAK